MDQPVRLPARQRKERQLPLSRSVGKRIRLEREIPRHHRFDEADDEQRLLAASSPHLYGVIVALLETACRVGEILNLQWGDVALNRRELTIRAEKAKTRTARLVPLFTR